MVTPEFHISEIIYAPAGQGKTYWTTGEGGRAVERKAISASVSLGLPPGTNVPAGTFSDPLDCACTLIKLAKLILDGDAKGLVIVRD
jgi:hypothetical protein